MVMNFKDSKVGVYIGEAGGKKGKGINDVIILYSHIYIYAHTCKYIYVHTHTYNYIL